MSIIALLCGTAISDQCYNNSYSGNDSEKNLTDKYFSNHPTYGVANANYNTTVLYRRPTSDQIILSTAFEDSSKCANVLNGSSQTGWSLSSRTEATGCTVTLTK